MKAGLFAAMGVVFFSAALLTVCFAVPAFAHLAGGKVARPTSIIAAAGAALASVSNIAEDGLDREWAFFTTIAGTVVLLAGLAGLAVAIVFGVRGRMRLLALIPLGTITAVVLYVIAGGPLMLITWFAAAGAALVLPRQRCARAR
jgi:hypothetical protein